MQPTTSTKAKAASNIPLLSSLTHDELKQLQNDVSLKQVPAGQMVVERGGQASAVFIILKGKVRLTLEPETPDAAAVPIATLKPGDHFGGVPYIDQGDWPYAARTVNEARFLIIPYGRFEKLIQQHPNVLTKLQASCNIRRLQVLLAQSGPFQYCDEKMRESLALKLDERTFTAGQVVVQEGERTDHVYLIQRGSVEISCVHRAQKVVLNLSQPGEFFGEVAFLTGRPREATATCTEDTQLYLLDRESLHQAIQKFPKVQESLQQFIHRQAEHVIWVLEKMVDKSIEEVVGREPEKTARGAARRFNVFAYGVEVRTTKEGEQLWSRLMDISGRGMYLLTDDEMQSGTTLRFRFQPSPFVPGAERLGDMEITGKVVRSSESGMGVEFVYASKAQASRVRDFVRAISRVKAAATIAPRYDLTAETVEMELTPAGAEFETMPAQLMNISLTGARIKVDEHRTDSRAESLFGEWVEVKVADLRGQSLEVGGLVIWAEGDTIGIEFDYFDQQAKLRVARTVEGLSRAQDDESIELVKQMDTSIPRKPKTPRKLRIGIKSEERFLSDYVSAIGAGGLFVEVAEPLDRGEAVYLVMDFSAIKRPPYRKLKILLAGQVARTVPGGIFVTIPRKGKTNEEAFRALRSLLQRIYQSRAKEHARPTGGGKRSSTASLPKIFMSTFLTGLTAGLAFFLWQQGILSKLISLFEQFLNKL